MSLLNNALIFLLKTGLDLLTLAFLLRFYFQLTKVSFQNQAAQAIILITDFAVKPTRRLVKSLKNFGADKLDTSTLLLAFLTQLLLMISLQWLGGFSILTATSSAWLILCAIALIEILSLSISIFLYAILAQAILSWVNPHTPIAPILNQLTHPILRFLRRFIPTSNNIDFSSLVFIISAQLLLTVILTPFERSLISML